MTRRSFLASLPLLPAALSALPKVAAAAPAASATAGSSTIAPNPLFTSAVGRYEGFEVFSASKIDLLVRQARTLSPPMRGPYFIALPRTP